MPPTSRSPTCPVRPCSSHSLPDPLSVSLSLHFSCLTQGAVVVPALTSWAWQHPAVGPSRRLLVRWGALVVLVALVARPG